MRNIDLDLLVDIAQEVEKEDPIDWDRLSVGKEQAYKMIATSVLEQFDKTEYTEEDKIILLSTITKMLVENMLLNLKIMELTRKLEDK
jgi:hypothetical protein